jgi:Inner membrane protein YgaP-like, transmembrane domain
MMAIRSVEDAVRGIAGIFVLASLALGFWVNPWFFAFTAFVGVNLLQSAFTGTCPMIALLRRVDWPERRRTTTLPSS